MSQNPTRSVNLRGIIRSAPFVHGFNDAVAGKPYDYDAYNDLGDTNDRWNYERGRMLGMVFDGPLKFGRTTNFYALLACSEAIDSGIII